MADEERQQPETTESEGRIRQFRHGLVRGLGIVAVVLFAVFALANSQRVDFSWVVGDTEVTASGGGVPLILLLLGAFLLGAVVGGSATALRRRRTSHRD